MKNIRRPATHRRNTYSAITVGKIIVVNQYVVLTTIQFDNVVVGVSKRVVIYRRVPDETAIAVEIKPAFHHIIKAHLISTGEGIVAYYDLPLKGFLRMVGESKESIGALGMAVTPVVCAKYRVMHIAVFYGDHATATHEEGGIVVNLPAPVVISDAFAVLCRASSPLRNVASVDPDMMCFFCKETELTALRNGDVFEIHITLRTDADGRKSILRGYDGCIKIAFNHGPCTWRTCDTQRFYIQRTALINIFQMIYLLRVHRRLVSPGIEGICIQTGSGIICHTQLNVIV